MNIEEQRIQREANEKKKTIFGTMEKYEEFADEWNRACGKINRGKEKENEKVQ